MRRQVKAPAPHPSGATPPPIPKDLVPRHVAIVMDGNGRWAKQRGLPRTKGHEEGESSLFDVVEGAIEIGVKAISAYAFSTENWTRSPDEVKFLMGFNRDVIRRRRDEMHALGVKVRWAGRSPRLWRSVIKELQVAEELTRDNDVLTLTMCVNYGGRAELADTARSIAREVAAGRLNPDKIDERTFARHLYVPEQSDADLVWRTSGEQRLSNFMLWQAAYSELVFTDVLWPDVDRRDLWAAIDDLCPAGPPLRRCPLLVASGPRPRAPRPRPRSPTTLPGHAPHGPAGGLQQGWRNAFGAAASVTSFAAGDRADAGASRRADGSNVAGPCPCLRARHGDARRTRAAGRPDVVPPPGAGRPLVAQQRAGKHRHRAGPRVVVARRTGRGAGRTGPRLGHPLVAVPRVGDRGHPDPGPGRARGAAPQPRGERDGHPGRRSDGLAGLAVRPPRRDHRERGLPRPARRLGCRLLRSRRPVAVSLGPRPPGRRADRLDRLGAAHHREGRRGGGRPPAPRAH